MVARSPRGILKSNTTDKLRFTTERFPSSGVEISLPEEAMVDDEYEDDIDDDLTDPLEVARQGTVHIWEDSNVILCHTGSEGQCDAFLVSAAAEISGRSRTVASAGGSEELYER